MRHFKWAVAAAATITVLLSGPGSKWTCRKINPQTKGPFKGPKPLPWSRLR
jgi:hypothetical protein